MTQYKFEVKPLAPGAAITVTRLEDNAEKVFTIAAQSDCARLVDFMSSVTDDQAKDYFPKPRKQK